MKYYFGGAIPLILLVAFITLKLFKVIAWSWWWVFAPVWMPIILIVLLGVYVVYTLRNEDLNEQEY